tara:strand:- start:27 stop:269 length:243 start_codon:yes stop_codon:yes gene_type:complete
MKDAVRRYIEKGIKPGHFLSAVIQNDLKESVGRADEENAKRLAEWVRFFYNEVPAHAWGSMENMREWINVHTHKRTDSET